MIKTMKQIFALFFILAIVSTLNVNGQDAKKLVANMDRGKVVVLSPENYLNSSSESRHDNRTKLPTDKLRNARLRESVVLVNEDFPSIPDRLEKRLVGVEVDRKSNVRLK